MNTQPEKQLPAGQQAHACHPSVRKWIYLRAVLLGLLVAAWWIMFVPASMMASGLKITLGIVVGLVATGSYLYNLRETLSPRPSDGARVEAAESPKD